MAEEQGLRLNRALNGLGMTDQAVEAFGTRVGMEEAMTPRDLIEFRRGVIDAARVLVDGVTELHTPEALRKTVGYQVGFEANSAVIMEKRMAA